VRVGYKHGSSLGTKKNAVYSKKHNKQINILHGQDVGFHNIRLGGTHTNYWVLQS
jgi:hypothetical protein